MCAPNDAEAINLLDDPWVGSQRTEYSSLGVELILYSRAGSALLRRFNDGIGKY